MDESLILASIHYAKASSKPAVRLALVLKSDLARSKTVSGNDKTKLAKLLINKYQYKHISSQLLYPAL